MYPGLSPVEAIATLAQLPIDEVPTLALWLEVTVRGGVRVECEIEASVAKVLDRVTGAAIRGFEGIRGAWSGVSKWATGAWDTFTATFKAMAMWVTMVVVLISFVVFWNDWRFRFVLLGLALLFVYRYFQ